MARRGYPPEFRRRVVDLVEGERNVPDQLEQPSIVEPVAPFERCELDLSSHSQADLNRIVLQLNQRPRKTLAFHSPAEVPNESVALTG